VKYLSLARARSFLGPLASKEGSTQLTPCWAVKYSTVTPGSLPAFVSLLSHQVSYLIDNLGWLHDYFFCQNG
jgi:hypothetical protein